MHSEDQSLHFEVVSANFNRNSLQDTLPVISNTHDYHDFDKHHTQQQSFRVAASSSVDVPGGATVRRKTTGSPQGLSKEQRGDLKRDEKAVLISISKNTPSIYSAPLLT